MKKILIYIVLAAVCASCQGMTLWQEAKAIVAIADSLDKNEGMLYDDTLSLRQAIGRMDNPFGRTFARCTVRFLLQRYCIFSSYAMVMCKCTDKENELYW